MKKCSYCGAEYPDDVVMCAIDQTPFNETKLEAVSPSHEIHKRKIPLSLSVVSYCFFASGVSYLGWVAIYAYLGRFLPLHLVIGVVNLFVSRGLRRCLPRWRICALVLFGLGFFDSSFRIIKHSAQTPISASLIAWCLSFAILAWFYRILTRSDIRILFYDQHKSAA